MGPCKVLQHWRHSEGSHFVPLLSYNDRVHVESRTSPIYDYYEPVRPPFPNLSTIIRCVPTQFCPKIAACQTGTKNNDLRYAGLNPLTRPGTNAMSLRRSFPHPDTLPPNTDSVTGMTYALARSPCEYMQLHDTSQQPIHHTSFRSRVCESFTNWACRPRYFNAWAMSWMLPFDAEHAGTGGLDLCIIVH